MCVCERESIGQKWSLFGETESICVDDIDGYLVKQMPTKAFRSIHSQHIFALDAIGNHIAMCALESRINPILIDVLISNGKFERHFCHALSSPFASLFASTFKCIDDFIQSVSRKCINHAIVTATTHAFFFY